MADRDSALPVRTEGDLQEKLQSKIVDYLDPSKGAEVDSDKNLHVEMHGNDEAGTDRVIKTSENGNIAIDGIYDAVKNTNPSRIGLIAHLRNATPGLAQLLQPLTAVTNGLKRLLDVSIHDEDGAAFSASNPLPVTLVDSEGVEVNNPFSSVAVAAGGSVDHDYPVTAAKTLKLSKVFASASGKLKAEVKVETALGSGTFTTVYTKFNSTANPNLEFDIKELITVNAGVKVRVTLTNREPQAQDLYSTISGHEI